MSANAGLLIKAVQAKDAAKEAATAVSAQQTSGGVAGKNGTENDADMEANDVHGQHPIEQQLAMDLSGGDNHLKRSSNGDEKDGTAPTVKGAEDFLQKAKQARKSKASDNSA